MRGVTFGFSLLVWSAVAIHVACPSRARAQYDCAVAIELKGKEVLQGRILDTERPSTDELWNLLKTLSFAPTANGKDLPSADATEQSMLKGKVRVKINSAGSVEVAELRLVRNPLNASAWVIAPQDVDRILKMRKSGGAEKR